MSNKKLQKVQNVAARIAIRMYRTKHTIPLLNMLNWLPVSSRIAYKIVSICHISLTIAYQNYLSELFIVYTLADHCIQHPLRSYNKDQVMWSANIRIPGTQQLDQSPW